MKEDASQLYKINESTLKSLMQKTKGINAEVRTYDNPLKGKWCVYPRSGIIAPRFPSPMVTAYAMSQYDTRGGNVKVLERKAARFGYLNSLGLLAAKSIDISGIDLTAAKMMFWWRGRSMRLFDFTDHTIIYKAKNDVPKNRVENYISFRKQHQYDFLLKLIDHGEDWYKEPIIYGKTLASYRTKKYYDALLKRSIYCMKQLAENTVTYKEPQEYISEICSKIERNTQALAKGSFSHEALIDIIEKLSIKAQQLDKLVPVVLAHCDLHPQNIMVGRNRKIYIIDWEANSLRSIWYDPASLLLDFRSASGMKSVINHCQSQEIIEKVLINDPQKNYQMESIISILLLESILGKTIIARDLKQGAGTVLDNFVNTISHISWYQNL